MTRKLQAERDGSNYQKTASRKRLVEEENHMGRLDSDQRYTVSKTAALPLGHAPRKQRPFQTCGFVGFRKIQKLKKISTTRLEIKGIEPLTSRMQNEYSNQTKLYSHRLALVFLIAIHTPSYNGSPDPERPSLGIVSGERIGSDHP